MINPIALMIVVFPDPLLPLMIAQTELIKKIYISLNLKLYHLVQPYHLSIRVIVDG